MGKEITIQMPYPPSTNRLWRQFRGRTIKSKEYREWIERASAALAGIKPVCGKYNLLILAARPDKRRRDVANLEKAISDALQAAGIVEDDSLAHSVKCEWDGECGDLPMIVVRI